MDRQFDRHLQRIVGGAIGNDDQGTPRSILDLPVTDGDWATGHGLPPMTQQSSLYNGFDPDFSNAPPQFQPSFGTGPRSHRISLPPHNSYNQVEAPRIAFSHLEYPFKSAQNFGQGMPFGQLPAPPNPLIHQSSDTIDNLVDSMLMHGPPPSSRLDIPALRTEFVQKSEPTNYFQDFQRNSLGQLQLQKQQIPPPFNLSGFAYSPVGQEESDNSSPMLGSVSSPTTRVSLRRSSQNGNKAIQIYPLDQVGLPQTPQRQLFEPANNTFRTLALPHAPLMLLGEIPVVTPHDLPDRFRHVFPYKVFNAVQSKCFHPIYKGTSNIVVASPTGSGKTALLELAICKLVESHKSGQFKIVYQAPTKSLCSERLRDWEKKFSHLNLPCAELTGDTNQSEMARVRKASIIVTTPEKWDSITRKWADHAKLVQMVKLFLIDEVHILKDPRGATLEAVVSRMKSMGTEVRFVAISATVPNYVDIARWLGKNHKDQHLEAHCESFDDSYRPVPLVKHVHGINGSLNEFAFEKTLDSRLPGIIQKYSQKKPIMVFCFTRKSCEATARILAEHWKGQTVADRPWPAPTKRIAIGSKDLQELVPCGIVFHHAGLETQDRHAIEAAYLKSEISVICCTSTLAVGVNLPCHLVILKGTVSFQEGKLCEYSDLDVMQMLGRAGRPQFDKIAVAVILTHASKEERYKKMISGHQYLESTLHLNLIEHLNSEISLGTVNDLSQAKKWISGTFLAVRIRQNPDWYRMPGVVDGWSIDRRLEQACERDITLLQEHSLVSDSERFSCTEYGNAMSRYMVQFDTMKEVLNLPRQAKIEQIIQMISQAAEFKDLRMRPAERPFLRDVFNKSPFIKYPIKENVTFTQHKISLMIQVQLGGIELPSDKAFGVIKRQFITETSIIFERVQRLIRCVIDCKAYDCDAVSVRHALELARSFSAQFWENSNLQLQQIPQVGPVGHRKLISSSINTVEDLINSDTSDIERILSKNPPFGSKMKDNLTDFPRLKLTADIIGQTSVKKGQNPKINVKAVVSYSNRKVPVWSGRQPSITFMAETTDGTLVHFWRGSIMKIEKGFELRFSTELSGPAELVKCWIACEEIVGTVKTCVLQPNIPVSAFPRPAPKPAPTSGVPVKSVAQRSIKGAWNDDDFGDDEFADDDMLAAVRRVESPLRNSGNNITTPVRGVEATNYYGSDDFTDIDDLDNDRKTTRITKPGKTKIETEPEDSRDFEIPESVQMANGRWTCNHICRDGAPTKTGKTCKHRCCNEGLEKPRKPLKKISKSQSGPDPKLPPPMNLKDFQDSEQIKFKSQPFDPNEISDTELVDLAQVLSPVPYEKVAPTEYQKLHNLHMKTQGNPSVRLLAKTKPQFSYSNGGNPELPFLQTDRDRQGSFDPVASPGPDDFKEDSEPSGSLHHDMGIFDEAFFGGTLGFDDIPSPSSFQADYMTNYEAGMIDFQSPSAPVFPATSYMAEGSFSTGGFDFAAYEMDGSYHTQSKLEAQTNTKEEPSSSLGPYNQTKRSLSEDEMEPEAKHRRLNNAEKATRLSQLPEWTSEIDQDIIDLLKDSVDFVDS